MGVGDALLYSTFLGGSGGESVGAITVDRFANAYVTGETLSPDFPTKNAFQEKLRSANGNAFITELDAAGADLVYSTFLGGSGGAQGTGIAVDTRGNAYVTGGAGPDFPIKNGFQKKLKGPIDAFVTKISAR